MRSALPAWLAIILLDSLPPASGAAPTQPVGGADPFGSDLTAGAGSAAAPDAFARFCAEEPLLGLAPGEKPLCIELLEVEEELSADEVKDMRSGSSRPKVLNITAPTSAMLAGGRLLRQQTRANNFSRTENVLLVDRDPSGKPLAQPQWVGLIIYTRLEDKGRGLQLNCKYRKSTLVKWVDYSSMGGGAGLEPVIEAREWNTVQSFRLGEWMVLVGGEREVVSVGPDGKEVRRWLQTRTFLRVVEDTGASGGAPRSAP